MYESQANMHILFILVDTHQPIHVLTSVNVKQIAYLRKNAILAVATFKYTKMLQISFLHLKNFLGEGAHPPPRAPPPTRRLRCLGVAFGDFHQIVLVVKIP